MVENRTRELPTAKHVLGSWVRPVIFRRIDIIRREVVANVIVRSAVRQARQVGRDLIPNAPNRIGDERQQTVVGTRIHTMAPGVVELALERLGYSGLEAGGQSVIIRPSRICDLTNLCKTSVRCVRVRDRTKRAVLAVCIGIRVVGHDIHAVIADIV